MTHISLCCNGRALCDTTEDGMTYVDMSALCTILETENLTVEVCGDCFFRIAALIGRRLENKEYAIRAVRKPLSVRLKK